MSKVLPSKANLSHLKKQAKELLSEASRGDDHACRRFIEHHPRSKHLFSEQSGADLSLHDAQLVIAREYGFESWPKLHAAVQPSAANLVASPLEKAAQDLRQGKMIILFDDEGRENEGDLVVAAEKVTGDAVNFMTKHGRGTLCLALTEQQVDRLQLPLMSPSRRAVSDPAFTLSIDAAMGITTGVSAADRSATIKSAIDDDATPASVRSPGHVFPLRAEKQGVLVRPGHTEGSIDLMKIAGLKPAAVICEILNDDGTMARWPDLLEVSSRLGIELIKISDIVEHRRSF